MDILRGLREYAFRVPNPVAAEVTYAEERARLDAALSDDTISELESRIWPITAGLPCEFGWGMISGYQGCARGNQPGLSGSRGSREGRRTSELTTWELIAEKAKVLPPEKQQEVLDFLEFLHERQQRKGPLRSLRGLWKDLGPGISAEEIDEARREMWGKFPRDDV